MIPFNAALRSILDRMCGSLCDAVLLDSSVSGQETLEYLERTNLFIIPLDNERRWYRYHHLFGGLLLQRQGQSLRHEEIAKYHIRASEWYEKNGDAAEAFRHAIAGRDFSRAAGMAEKYWQGMNENCLALQNRQHRIGPPKSLRHEQNRSIAAVG